VNRSLFVVGSREGLRAVFGDQTFAARGPDVDVVILPTAAAFTGAAEASVAVAQVCDEFDVRVESLMVTDRASAGEAYFCARIVEADLVVLCDGSALHARAVWRNTPVGDAIGSASNLVAIGSVASVLGDVMIDPRGGAPTIGMDLCRGVAFCAPSSDDQLARTRSLVAKDTSLVVVGPRGVLRYANEAWRVIEGDDVVVTRGQDAAAL
jgi:hypothetical protein